jgi:BirA family biotin operon repressor/biotin-[acetyl-CoA-carboxylase] ligase
VPPPRCSSGPSRLIEYSSETGSTNADAAARLRSGDHVPESTWFVTDRQTDGRGRHGRAWSNGAGNFMGSTVVQLRHGDPAVGTLSLVAGLAVHAAVTPLLPPGQSALLKWPNDVLIGCAKLVGILLERERDAVIVGIGVNLAAAPSLPDRETISLADLGVKITRDTFAETLATEFDRELERWRTYGLGPIVNRWIEAAHPIGTPLTVSLMGELPLEGAFAGLAPDGALQLRLADGTTHVIQSGEVSLA